MKSTHRRLSALLALALCAGLLGCPAGVAAEQSGDFTYAIREDGYAVITGYTGHDDHLIIPAQLGGYPVKAIGAYSLSNYNCYPDRRKTFSTVVIPDSVTEIGDYAFYACDDLVAVNIPRRVTLIGNNAFMNCEQLTSISIPGSVARIGKGAFYYTGLTSLTLENGVTEIGAEAFYGCSINGSVEIPKSVTVIGTGAFSFCENIKAFYVQPGNPAYATIDGVLFEKATRTLVQYPLSKPEADYEIPYGIEVIGFAAFAPGRRGLTVSFPLRSISIPSSVKIIGHDAFDGNAGITEIVLPDSVTDIGYFAFSACVNLQRITIPTGVTVLSLGAFSNCSNLREVILPDTLTEIQPMCFSGCDSLRQIDIPDSVTFLDLSMCQWLTSIAVPKSITHFNFSFCDALKEVVLSDGITEIPSLAFWGCSALSEIKLPKSIRFIGDSAFRKCTTLTTLDLSQCPLLLAIGTDAFEECTALTSVTFPDSLITVDSGAFRNCTALITVKCVKTDAPNVQLLPGEINYIPQNDRTAMIRFLARHYCRQQGYTVLPDVDADRKPLDKNAWREEKIEGCLHKIAEAQETIVATNAELGDPQTNANKARVLNNRIASMQHTIEENEAAIAAYTAMRLLTDTEAASLYEMAEHITDAPECGQLLLDAMQATFVHMQTDDQLPEGFRSLTDYITSEDGLRLTVNDAKALEHIMQSFDKGADGSLTYLPGSGYRGVDNYAFDGCSALSSLDVPSGMKVFSALAFTGCDNLTITVEVGSPAEQYCQDRNIHFQYTDANSWLDY